MILGWAKVCSLERSNGAIRKVVIHQTQRYVGAVCYDTTGIVGFAVGERIHQKDDLVILFRNLGFREAPDSSQTRLAVEENGTGSRALGAKSQVT